MTAVDIWFWDGGKVLRTDNTRPAGVPADAVAGQQDVPTWVEEIKQELVDIDARSIRALRENNAALLAQYESRAEVLREILRALA